jgi:hypothetical protein
VAQNPSQRITSRICDCTCAVIEHFERRHRLGDLLGAGNVWLQALDEPPHGMSRENDPRKVILGDQPAKVRLGFGFSWRPRHLADATKARVHRPRCLSQKARIAGPV